MAERDARAYAHALLLRDSPRPRRHWTRARLPLYRYPERFRRRSPRPHRTRTRGKTSPPRRPCRSQALLERTIAEHRAKRQARAGSLSQGKAGGRIVRRFPEASGLHPFRNEPLGEHVTRMTSRIRFRKNARKFFAQTWSDQKRFDLRSPFRVVRGCLMRAHGR